jgi:hypothetical protein
VSYSNSAVFEWDVHALSFLELLELQLAILPKLSAWYELRCELSDLLFLPTSDAHFNWNLLFGLS